MTRLGLAAAVAVLCGVALWTWGVDSSRSVSASPRQRVAAVPAPAPIAVEHRAAVVAAVGRAAALPPPLPPGSLRDTDVDGGLAVDADGNLLISPALRRFFEYFFVASGEDTDEVIRTRIVTEIARRAHGEAQRAALELLERYLTYRERGRTLIDADAADGDLAPRLEALRALRRDSFGERDAAALFADEEAAFAVAVAQRRIADDPSLSDAERAAQLAAVEAQVPDALRESREAATAPLRLAQDEAALRAAGGAAEEIQALRERAVGAEAAQRLAALDERRAAWQGRVDAYRQQRAALDSDASLSAEQREAAREALRAEHFSGAELVRIRALDRLAAAAPP